MDRVNIKQQYRDYCFHKERIGESFLSYNSYWKLRLDKKTPEELLEYTPKYGMIKKEYTEYLNNGGHLTYNGFKKKRNLQYSKK